MNKSNLGKKGLISPYSNSVSRKSKQHLKAEHWGRNTRREMLLTGWLVFHGFLNLFSYTIQGHLPRGGTAHSELNPSTSVINQDNAPID